jgi:hypothetical protein
MRRALLSAGTAEPFSATQPGSRCIDGVDDRATGHALNKSIDPVRAMMQGSFKMGTLAGIDVRIHYTWLLAIF